MISEQTIEKLVEEKIKGTPVFLVQVKVKPANKIEIFIDEPNHITIETCREVSKHVEAGLNRDDEDFELMVSSPGIDEAFTVLPQYQKYIGKQVSVIKKDGIKIIGALAAATDTNLTIETKTRERKQIGKGKQTVIENVTIDLDKIKETKLILPF
ncbi:MAG TPA: ribosome assembly cofactor RimP [Bacteroidia bacterium]|nr:ribosome assembly cofactor RimP [Bacteroidia bacterium]